MERSCRCLILRCVSLLAADLLRAASRASREYRGFFMDNLAGTASRTSGEGRSLLRCTAMLACTVTGSLTSCTHHSMLIQNLLLASARKNLGLSERIMHTSPKSIRGRLVSFFSAQAARQGSQSFSIPFNRQQLADYLEVDRSALSAELGKMKKEGLLDFWKNQFVLKTKENK